jgi:hypothetical protein
MGMGVGSLLAGAAGKPIAGAFAPGGQAAGETISGFMSGGGGSSGGLVFAGPGGRMVAGSMAVAGEATVAPVVANAGAVAPGITVMAMSNNQGSPGGGGGGGGSGYYRSGRPDKVEGTLVRSDRRKVNSPQFLDFLESQGISRKGWQKVMETWRTPGGAEVERHYWTNGNQSFYHL